MKRLKLLVCGIAGLVMLGWVFAQEQIESVAEPRPVFDLPLVAPEAAPEIGTFWLYSGSGEEGSMPPYPFDPYAGVLPIYTLPGLPNQYLIADTPTDFAQLQAIQFEMAQLESNGGMMMNSLEFPGEGETNYSGEGSWEGSYGMMSYPSNSLWLEITSVSNGVANIIIHGTVPEVWYELLSKEELANTNWQSESPLWLGTTNQDWTPATVTVGTRTNHLFLWARSWADEDGNGLPDWWEQQFFGMTAVDGYADGDGDGWVNIQEWQNGTSPNAFNTPAAPQGITVALGSAGTTSTVRWFLSNGSVTNYTVERALDYSEELYGGDTFPVSGNATSWNDNTGELPSGFYFDPRSIAFVQSILAVHQPGVNGNQHLNHCL